MDWWEPIDGHHQILDCRFDPADSLQDLLMLLQQILSIPDWLMMKDAVAVLGQPPAVGSKAFYRKCLLQFGGEVCNVVALCSTYYNISYE